MIGDLSVYPQNYDYLYNVYEENYNGYSLTEKRIIPGSPYELELNHYAKEGTIIIPGYIETTNSSPLLKEFYVIDYYIPTNQESKTGIDYKIGKKLRFNANDTGNIINITYVSPGDKITANLFNLLIDAIYKIQRILGRIGERRDLEIESHSNTLAGYIAWLKQVLLTHSHTGGSADWSTQPLPASAIADAVWDNSHIAENAGINQSKLEKGIKDWGIGTIPTGTSKQVIINTSAWKDSEKIVMLSRGVNGYSDAGDIGILYLDGSYSSDDGFRVKYSTNTSSLTTAIYFYWILY